MAAGGSGEKGTTSTTFEVTRAQPGGETEVAVTGELDVYTSPRLRDLLDGLSDDEARTVVFDLSGMHFVDSTGLGLLVSALTRAQDLGGSARLRAPNPATAKLLEITGLGHLFAVESVD